MLSALSEPNRRYVSIMLIVIIFIFFTVGIFYPNEQNIKNTELNNEEEKETQNQDHNFQEENKHSEKEKEKENNKQKEKEKDNEKEKEKEKNNEKDFEKSDFNNLIAKVDFLIEKADLNSNNNYLEKRISFLEDQIRFLEKKIEFYHIDNPLKQEQEVEQIFKQFCSATEQKEKFVGCKKEWETIKNQIGDLIITDEFYPYYSNNGDCQREIWLKCAGQNLIPKQVYQIVFGDNPNEKKIKTKFRETKDELIGSNDGYQFNLFTDNEFEKLLSLFATDEEQILFQNIRSPALRSEFSRVLLMYHLGGIFMSPQVNIKSPFQNWISTHDSCVLFYSLSKDWDQHSDRIGAFGNAEKLIPKPKFWEKIENSFFACSPRHPFMEYLKEEMIHQLKQLLFEQVDALNTMEITGTIIWKHTFQKYYRYLKNNFYFVNMNQMCLDSEKNCNMNNYISFEKGPDNDSLVFDIYVNKEDAFYSTKIEELYFQWIEEKQKLQESLIPN
ncbi:mannosyl phosphorylinositol ceramide synthase [Anaeramoeba flamelloides]|uniref:Mannosyl phosphorylinositol ceramide synthase n=1 Tax=Anaeramoeba flamelloides TaxID=1746091 RepID=A0AAV7YRN3_9EUKA|nr:mannosyl phosphorylinositol ceramide synthase [Anaeramoeba flamelloides]